MRNFVLKAFTEKSINRKETSTEKCSEKDLLCKKWALKTLVKIHEKYQWVSLLLSEFTTKVTGDKVFLKITSFTSTFEEVWQQFQQAAFMNTYCLEQIILHNSSDCNF